MHPRLRSILEWAASYNAPLAERYGTIRLDAERLLKEGKETKEITEYLKQRIDSLALRAERTSRDEPLQARFTQSRRN